jgi:hypothetical protein
LGKSHSGSSSQAKLVTFFIDECLPYQIALMLKQVGYPVTCWWEEFQQQQGFKDPFIIPHLGAKRYTWITKDDEAKKEHKEEIRIAQISVIWVYGLDRTINKPKHNKISIKDLHRMLTDKLDDIENMIVNSNKPQYFTLGLQADGKPRLNKTTLDDFFKNVTNGTN